MIELSGNSSPVETRVGTEVRTSSFGSSTMSWWSIQAGKMKNEKSITSENYLVQ